LVQSHQVLVGLETEECDPAGEIRAREQLIDLPGLVVDGVVVTFADED